MPPRSDETAIARPGDVYLQIRGLDRRIAAVAERQHGVVGRRQLLELGLGREAIEVRLRAGRLHRLHAGVYAVGHRLVSREGRWMAAVLAGGKGAVLSHRSAATLWGIQRVAREAVEITTPRASRSRGALQRHCGDLRSDEMAIRRRIPVTTASRTLLDLAAVVPPDALELALREAEVRCLPLRPSLDELLARHPRRRGVGSLRACLRRLGRLPPGRRRSRIEDRFLAFVARFDLPRPAVNVLLELETRVIEADCLWREPRLIVELDGHESHGTRAAFESDRKRDRDLRVAGWSVVRVTWRQLEDEPEVLASDLRNLLPRT